jgi:hypothetical protein
MKPLTFDDEKSATKPSDIYIYIYIYIERERERERGDCMERLVKADLIEYTNEDTLLCLLFTFQWGSVQQIDTFVSALPVKKSKEA